MAIVKILSRHNPSYASLIRYVMQGECNDRPEIFTHNLRSDTEAGYVGEFVENESFRRSFRSDQAYLFHEIISFNAKEDRERITSEVMEDIAREYMRLRGNDGVMLGAVHRDRGHVHLHLCVSALRFRTGTSFRLSKAELFRLKTGLQEYHREKYPFLSRSFPNHGAGKPYEGHGKWLASQREIRIELKERLGRAMAESLAVAKTQDEFLGIMRDRGFHHYERRGKAEGIEVDGMRFRFSRLADRAGLEALPMGLTEEQKALEEIRAIREGRAARDTDRELDDRTV
ncbi:MAG: relaxase/mobilization nuclease domain-containing protein [Candidatus Paceibacterota bacterium]|jgi:hypothetical protein